MNSIPAYNSVRMYARVIPSTSETTFYEYTDGDGNCNLRASHASASACLIFTCGDYPSVLLEYNVLIDWTNILPGKDKEVEILKELEKYGRIIAAMGAGTLLFKEVHLTLAGKNNFVNPPQRIVAEVHVDGRVVAPQ